LKTNELSRGREASRNTHVDFSKSTCISSIAPIQLDYGAPLICQNPFCKNAPLTSLLEWTQFATHICTCGQRYQSQDALFAVLQTEMLSEHKETIAA